MLDRQRSLKEVLLIANEASAEYAINNTSFVDLYLSSIVASHHLLSDLVHTSYKYIICYILYMYVYVHEFVYVQSCLTMHDLTSKGHMTNCCQLLITT